MISLDDVFDDGGDWPRTTHVSMYSKLRRNLSRTRAQIVLTKNQIHRQRVDIAPDIKDRCQIQIRDIHKETAPSANPWALPIKMTVSFLNDYFKEEAESWQYTNYDE